MRIVLIILFLILGFLYWKIWDHQKISCCEKTPTTELEVKSEGLNTTSQIVTSSDAVKPNSRSISVDGSGRRAAWMDFIVDFGYKSSVPVLNDSLTLVIDSLPSYLEKYGGYLVLTGHTDNDGTPEENINEGLLLSSVVKDFLIQKGIKPADLHVYSKGESNPIADNESSEGKSKNRRVEIKFVKN